MASTIHLDPNDLVKAGKAFGLDIAKQDGGFTVTWPQARMSVELRNLQLNGSFTFEQMRVEAEVFGVTEAGVEAKFRVL